MVEVCERKLVVTDRLFSNLGRTVFKERGKSLIDYAMKFPDRAYMDTVAYSLSNRSQIMQVSDGSQTLNYDPTLMGIKKADIVDMLLSSVVEQAVEMSVHVELGKPRLWPRIKDIVNTWPNSRTDMSGFDQLASDAPVLVIAPDFTTVDSGTIESRIEEIINTPEF